MMTLAVIGVWFLVTTFMAIVLACGVLVDKILNTNKYERWHERRTENGWVCSKERYSKLSGKDK